MINEQKSTVHGIPVAVNPLATRFSSPLERQLPPAS